MRKPDEQCLKGLPAEIAWVDLRARAAALEKRFRLPFARYVERMRSMNRWTSRALRLRAAGFSSGEED